MRVQILGKEEVPSLNETISLIRAEESRRGVMLEPQTVEGSAMVTTKDQPSSTVPGKGRGEGQGRDHKESLWCNYCKKSRHTRETCWKLHGKPPSREWGHKGGQPKPQGRAHFSGQPTEQPSQEQAVNQMEFNKEEIEKLRGLLGSLEKTGGSLEKTGGTCSLAFSGKFSTSQGLHVSDKVIQELWVIDSGATDHMTHSSLHFCTYSPCPSNRKITVADGSLITVAGLGNIQLSPFITLKKCVACPKIVHKFNIYTKAYP